MKKTLLILMIFISSSLIYSQITLTKADVTNAYDVGSVLAMRSDTVNYQVNIGQLGSTSWDFSNLTAHSTFYDTSVALNATPYANLFPSSNIALHGGILEDTVPANLYQYITLNDTTFSLNGIVTAASLLGSSFVVKTSNSPGQLTIKMPLTFGTNWSQNYTTTYVTEINGIPFSTSSVANTSDYQVDAYGSLTLPGGQTFQALRLKQDEKSYDNSSNSYDRTISYLILTKEGFYVSFTASDTLQPNNGTIMTSGVTWSGPNVVGVTRDDNIKNYSFKLSQNYPNPFNPSTVINFEVDKESYVELKVFNVIGKETASLVQERLAPGNYNINFDANNLTAGIYFARLTANGITQTIKMTLLK